MMNNRPVSEEVKNRTDNAVKIVETISKLPLIEKVKVEYFALGLSMQEQLHKEVM